MVNAGRVGARWSFLLNPAIFQLCLVSQLVFSEEKVDENASRVTALFIVDIESEFVCVFPIYENLQSVAGNKIRFIGYCLTTIDGHDDTNWRRSKLFARGSEVSCR